MCDNGKRMICDFRKVQNVQFLNDVNKVQHLLDVICTYNNLHVTHRMNHNVSNGVSVIYMLPKSHISIHTFPDTNQIAFDFYFSNDTNNNNLFVHIFDFLIKALNADKESSTENYIER